METALESKSIIAAAVISTPDAAKRALPITHSPCTIIKVHRDYLDTRIKNTPTELSGYDDCINQLLDQILDEFGLIVCGWSAEWDDALRAAFESCKNHRFTTYWAIRDQPGKQAQKLIALRRAVPITAQDADTFFTELSEKVAALESYARPHPLSVEVAVATRKKYLVDNTHYRRCYDRVEYLFALVYAHVDQHPSGLGPIGCFGWRDWRRQGGTIRAEIEREARDAGEDWPPLKAGLFDGSPNRFREIKAAFDESIGALH